MSGLCAAVESSSSSGEERMTDLLQDSGELSNLVESCLIVDPSNRPLTLTFREGSTLPEEKEGWIMDDIFVCFKRSADVSIEAYKSFRDDPNPPVRDWRWRPIEELMELWRLGGPSVETIMLKAGLLKINPPITTLPDLMSREGALMGREEERRQQTDLELRRLPTRNLRERLAESCPDLNPTQLTPLSFEGHKLPTPVKERDIRYQLERMVEFRGLLSGLPSEAGRLWTAARQDVPPLYRGLVWSALLGVGPGPLRRHAEELEVVRPTPTDRQIEVDAPRCHQYDALMSSPEAQGALKRLLKAWLMAHPQYVYWQGLDSLSTPFLHLHYANPPLAFASLSAFIPRYLYNFFKYDNSAIIQEYLSVFNHLIAFHDPVLATHLKDIDFFPELYAIPWFLTMFAHVFPLGKLYHLWDTLLLGDSSFPLCVGVAILHQLRPLLLSQGFNESILLFSDLPEIDIERCVEDSVGFFCATPKSVTFRAHAPPTPKAEGRAARLGTFTAAKPTPDAALDPELYVGPTATPPCVQAPALEDRVGLSIPVLKGEPCPRLSLRELLELSGGLAEVAARPGLDAHRRRLPVFAVDARSFDEFQRGTFPGAVNIPWREEGAEEETLGWQKLKAARGSALIVVFHRNHEHCVNLCWVLVRSGFPRVSLLHGGVQGLRKAKLLAVPTPVIH